MNASTTVPSYVDPELLASYLARTRWFGGKGRPFTVTGFEILGSLPGDGPPVVIHAVDVTYADAEPGPGATERYQVPLSYYTHPVPRLDHAFVGWWEDPDHGWVHTYDAMHDRETTPRWLKAFEGQARAGSLAFHRLPGHEIDPEASASLFAGEQSNSSVVFDDDAVMKLFRKLTPGVNPDIEVHDVLTRAASTHIAALYGWVDLVDPAAPEGSEPTQLAMLQQFLRTATDGWDLALSSVRTLYAEGDVPVAESGGDFAPEAARLGEALREVHDAMEGRFPPSPPLTAADLASAMTARLDDAMAAVPRLAQYEERLRSAFDIGDLGEVVAQRVHGDLHLGQTLRTALGWKIVDFEGEPAKPLEVRRRPDSRWRDVAGMLRSFDYAPRVVDRSLGEGDGHDEDEADRRAMLADQWSTRNAAAFLAAYSSGDLGSTEERLLAAYVADKAVYETVYETRNRPTWVEIPLAAVARIGEA